MATHSSVLAWRIPGMGEPDGLPSMGSHRVGHDWSDLAAAAIPLLDIHTKETRIERDTCAPVFTAALFTIARTWKQPRCPSADEWIRKLWYIYTMECLSYKKEHIWVSCNEVYDQSEVNQKEKDKYCILTMMVLTILHAGQQRRHRGKEQTFGLWKRREWDDLRE